MVLLLDNYDSFTYNLVDYFNQLGVEVKLFKNDDSLDKITSYSYSGVVLSPGPETPQKAGCLMDVLSYYYNKLPILGICLGHQAIGEFFGGCVDKAIRPMHGKVSSVTHDGDFLFDGLPEKIKVVRYHSLVVKKMPACLCSTALTDEGEVMAIKHNCLPIRGLQFHPEAILTESGLKMLKNWLSFNNIAF